MSVAFNSINGVVFCDSRRAYNGVTLFTPISGKGIWLIDMQGSFVNYWEMGYEPGCYGELLPNGNLLYGGKIAESPLADLEGTGGILLEADWNGKVVWEYKDPNLHHAFYRMKNGNTLVLKWTEVPKKVAAKVEGGDPGTERKGVMWGDVIQEISPEGETIWEWVAHENLDPKVDVTCPICPRSTWTHINSCVELPDGNILVNLMKNHTIAIINKKTGKIQWRWGPLGHQHSPSIMDNGNILVFDNGLHPRGYAPGVSAVLEINPESNKVVWSYRGGEKTPQYFYSSTMSSCQRLSNGNTFICEGLTGRLFEVSPNGELVWEYVNNLPTYEPSPVKTKTCMVYSAYRYGINYPGLKRPFLMQEGREFIPGNPAMTEEKPVESRLEDLGY